MKINWKRFEVESGKAPKWYGLSYHKYELALSIYHPIPLNYIVRYSRRYYWKFLRIFYWVGLIDTAKNEIFIWNDFWRIKSH